MGKWTTGMQDASRRWQEFETQAEHAARARSLAARSTLSSLQHAAHQQGRGELLSLAAERLGSYFVWVPVSGGIGFLVPHSVPAAFCMHLLPNAPGAHDLLPFRVSVEALQRTLAMDPYGWSIDVAELADSLPALTSRPGRSGSFDGEFDDSSLRGFAARLDHADALARRKRADAAHASIVEAGSWEFHDDVPPTM